MKRQVNRAMLAIFTLLLVGIGSLSADDQVVNLESKVIQDFSKPEAQNWYAVGSKFSTGDPENKVPEKNFPKLGFIKGGPTSIVGSDPQAAQNAKSLSVAMLFDRKEFNWVDIIPGTPDKPTEIPLPGRVKMIDMWVWSGNYNYYLEAFVRDYRGVVYTIPMGDLNFVGWKNLRINIPENVPQAKKYLPKRESLTLVKFRIWTRPTEVVVIPGVEPVDPQNPTPDELLKMAVKFNFNTIKVLTDTFESLFDGDTLDNPDVYKDVYGASAKK
jgi:hypothetical protein